MDTNTYNHPFSNDLLAALSEVLNEKPKLLVDKVFAARIQLQGRFSTPCPLVVQMHDDHVPAVSSAQPLPGDPWRICDSILHGLLIRSESDLAMLYSEASGGYALKGWHLLTEKDAPHSLALSSSKWFGLELSGIISRGGAFVTLFNEGEQEVPGAWTNAVNYAISLLRRRVEGTTSKFVCHGEGRTITSPAFNEALLGLPPAYVNAMQDLTDELAIICWHLTQEVFACANSSPVNTLWHGLSMACSNALIPGLRALALHGFGWPANVGYHQNSLLKHIRSKGTVSRAEILRFDRSLDSGKRDALVSHLKTRGVLMLEGTTVAVVEPSDFFRAQLASLAANPFAA